jgi:hypothetical protein
MGWDEGEWAVSRNVELCMNLLKVSNKKIFYIYYYTSPLLPLSQKPITLQTSLLNCISSRILLRTTTAINYEDNLRVK